MENVLKQYLKTITDKTIQGDHTEGSYYGSIEQLFSNYPLEKGRKTNVTTLPKKTDAGNPDFRVWDGENFIVGYIEAKNPGANLDQWETSEQLQRYLTTFPNVILTNFYEFRLYREGIEMHRATIARYHTARQLKSKPVLENLSDFEKLADAFYSFKLPKTFTAESLATQLAKRTSFLRDILSNQLDEEMPLKKGDLYGYYQAFQEYLIPSLTPESFADLYAQTITYGLFAARTRNTGEFTRKNAYDYIPHTTGILRDVFRYISLGNPSEQMSVTIDEISAVLNVADVNSIMDQFYKQGKGEDPIIHFYETFLNQYDPSTREKRGVYYTPEPVVKYIVRSVHEILKSEFNMPDGLANEGVTLLDPAAGTLTFPAEAIKLAVEEYVSKYGEGGKENFIRKQILPNFYAFELMMAPYAIGHMKIAYLLESLGFEMKGDDSFKLYLTNTLEIEEIQATSLPFVNTLSKESHKAAKVKQEPILVVLGNPPYSGISSNQNEWTEKLLKTDIDFAQSYYKVDGNPLRERKIWLQDDYVKFLRFAQWKIQKAGKGIVAMITNHAWLANPTFRGMRQSLSNTFDKLYVIDLHGSTLRNEQTPVGSKDENVFDIRAGVAISILIKNNNKNTGVLHFDLYGLRHEKYEVLEASSVNSFEFESITPFSPFYFFFPFDTSGIENYQNWFSVKDIFPVNVSGIVTARDGFVIDSKRKDLEHRIELMRDLSIPQEIITSTFKLKDTRSWKVNIIRETLSKMNNWENKITKIAYRPFDERYIFYGKELVDWPRPEVMRHMNEDNLALVTVRQSKTGSTWQHAFISTMITESCLVSNQTSEIGYVFPLYLYPDETKVENMLPMDSLPREIMEKTANIDEGLFSELEKTYKKKLRPEDVLYYVYAILYSDAYREMYVEFLKIDFPRIPFTKDYDVFVKMSKLGERLKNLHLITSEELDIPSVKYQGQSDNIVKFRRYNQDERRLYINEVNYFENVEPEVWEYQIGGYQVLDKYLKDRRNQKLESPRHVIRIATALEKTIEIQEEIDELYPEVEKTVI